ncbi:hypothetical protein BCN13_28255, partial [Salmonella enterica]|nr:hypothetical protein [Salmonella enterica]
INLLDGSVVNEANRENLLAKRIENMTSIDMGGTAIFDDSDKDDKGWSHDYTLEDLPNHGWIFNNTIVNSGGDVDVKGAGFTNSTINVTSGNLNIDNNGATLLTGTTITVGDGAVNVHAGAGNIDLSKGNISAKGNVTLQAANGSISISGTSATETASITSDRGSVSVRADATKSGKKVDGVFLDNIVLSAGEIINITGAIGNEVVNSVGVAGVKFSGDVSLTSMMNIIEGKNIVPVSYDGKGAGVELYQANVVFVGDTTIHAESESFSGLLFNEYYSSNNCIEFRDGSSTIHATDKGNQIDIARGVNDQGAIGILSWLGRSRDIEFKLSNASLSITAESMGESVGGLKSYSVFDGPDEIARKSGYKFTGQGDVSVTGTADKGDAVDLRVLDNRGLNGKFTVNGKSNRGVGVIVPEFANVDVINATITGSSHSGTGIRINAADKNTHQVNLNGNTLIGTSDTSTGININGNNVTITNGTLNGTATSGNGAGVTITGGTNYTLDGAKVTGQSADGAGVSVGGTLTVNNGTVVNGTSSGSGAGVSVAGTLTTTSGDGVTLKGKSDSGDGVRVAGDTSLMNASVDGTSASGIGTNINGCLTVSGTSGIKGTSTSGAGLNIDKSVTVAETDRSTVTFTGTST